MNINKDITTLSPSQQADMVDVMSTGFESGGSPDKVALRMPPGFASFKGMSPTSQVISSSSNVLNTSST